MQLTSCHPAFPLPGLINFSMTSSSSSMLSQMVGFSPRIGLGSVPLCARTIIFIHSHIRGLLETQWSLNHCEDMNLYVDQLINQNA